MPSRGKVRWGKGEKERIRANNDRVGKGVWLLAGTPTSKPYPCTCGPACTGRIDPETGFPWCPCYGRPTRRTAQCCGGPQRVKITP